MKNWICDGLQLVTAAAALVCFGTSAWAVDFIDLGDGGVTGGPNGEVRANTVRAINDSGQTTGEIYSATDTLAYRGTPGAPGNSIGSLVNDPTTISRAAYDINNSGQVLGRMLNTNLGISDLFVTSPTGDLSTAALISSSPDWASYGGFAEFRKMELNDSGLVSARLLSPDGNSNYAVRWNSSSSTVNGQAPNSIMTIAAPAGYSNGTNEGSAINNSGQVAGAFFNPTTGLFDAFVTDANGANATIIRGGYTGNMNALDMNNLGTVVGKSGGGLMGAWAFVPTGANSLTGITLNMNPLNGHATSAAMAINDSGFAVGYAGENDGQGHDWEVIAPNNGLDYDAFVWDTNGGNVTGIDLQQFVSSDYDLQAATGINSEGDIVGLYKLNSDIAALGFDNAPLRSFELTNTGFGVPAPEPASAVLLVCGAAGLLARRRRRA